MGKEKPTILSGFMELLPAEQLLFNRMFDDIRSIFELFGFSPLDTVGIERADVLLAKGGGETDKQVYTLTKGDARLALPFDLTVPLARYVAQNYTHLAFPFRRYHMSKVHRGERPQKGRYREFYQCDIDIIGDGTLSLVNDAEIPSIIAAVFRKLGFGSFTIRINNRKILNGLFESFGIAEKSSDVLRTIDKLEKIGEDNVRAELKTLELLGTVIDKVFEFIAIKGTNDKVISQLRAMGVKNETFTTGVNELEKVVEGIAKFGVTEDNYQIDLTIARGLDYYTGTVYETVLDDHPEIGSVCSGGRYDNLAECYTDYKLPGVGISIGLTRLFSKLLEAGIIKPETSTTAKVLVIPLDGKFDKAMEVAAQIREAGIPTCVYPDEVRPSKAFKYAHRIGVPFTIIIGGREAEKDTVSLKNMKSKVQEEMDVATAIRAMSA